MIKYTDYKGYGYCSFCGSPEPKKAIQNLTPTRVVIIPTCVDCYKELTKKGGKTNGKRTRTKKQITRDENEVRQSEG